MASGKNYLTTQKYFKPNYYEAIKYIIPNYLTEDDIDNFGQDVDLRDQVLNSNISLADNLHTIIEVSSIEGTFFSSIDTLSGIAPYFVKQNNLTNITTRKFEDKILAPLGKSILEYDTSAQFSNYISGTLLPSIHLNDPTATFVDGHSPSDTHNYLIQNLSWLYFLNTSGPNEFFDPSTLVTEKIVSNIFEGKPVETVDGIKMLCEFIWRDKHTDYYPSVFQASTTTFTSGTQQLENLKTWIDVIYSPLHADRADFTVRDRFNLYISNSVTTENKIPNGPFTKFLRALSFFAQDINDTSERIGSIYDISDCPEEYLPLLAELIGWDLFGNDPDRWRLQLRNAVDIYQVVGTKRSLQLAVNSILPKDQFGIETSVTEVYESYVPYLIYYALATDSSYFKSFDEWTEPLAGEMQVSGYSTTSLDENIKLAVDRILLEVYDRFSNTLRDIPNKEKGFTYRGRNYPIPPFEEYPYYVNLELNREIIEFIKDRLVCFGCTKSFADSFETYLVDNALDLDDEPRTSSFLLFTSGYNDPPNLSELIASGYNEKFEYASLWSGKSSHYKIRYDASSFDFTDTTLDSSTTGEAFLVASKLAKDFTPAHSIPLITLDIAYLDRLSPLVVSSLPLIQPRCEEPDPRSARNYFVSGLGFDSYMREVRTGGTDLPRITNAYDSEIIDGTNLYEIPRTSVRRRNYEKVMPSYGYYDRTGFNMPVDYDMVSSISGIPLGYVPSSLTYASVGDHVDLPEVWRQCEGFNSANDYYGYDVSNTLNVRGASGSFLSNLDRTVDRCQLPDIYAVMHSVKERVKTLEASATYSPIDLYYLQVSNAYLSYANYDTENLNKFPNSVEDYYNFSFGRDLHRLYNIYVTDFNNHRMIERLQTLDGANIFSHTFGPTLFNHDFEILGTDLQLSSILTSSLSSSPLLTPQSSSFSDDLAYEATGANDMYLDTFELVLSGAISGVELIHTSASPNSNGFSIFNVPYSLKKSTDDPYMFNSTFVLSKSTTGGLPRVRFDISKYSAKSDRPIQTNFLLPDHQYEAKTRLLISNSTGSVFGGRQVGVWIHTKPESGKMWSYGKDGEWTQHEALTTKSNVINNYSHIFNIPLRQADESASQFTNYQCIDNVLLNSEVSPVSRLSQGDFEEFVVKFDTRNRDLKLPIHYRKNHDLLHRKDQEYVIEVFLVPNNDSERFLLIDTVEVQNMTLKKMSEIFATGRYQDPLCIIPELVGNCPEYRVDLSKDELRKVFRFFNDISGKNSKTGLASRDKTETETIMGSEGGSKLDYRYKKEFFTLEEKADYEVIDSINIDT